MKRKIIKDGYGQITEKKSRFLGQIHAVGSPEEALERVTEVKKKYFDAKHHCYAYLCGDDADIKKYSDDGEPSGTAGMPLLNILESEGLTDCVVIVTRYFGGVLLGTGGLVRAYRAAGEEALKDAVLADITKGLEVFIKADYSDESRLRRIFENMNSEGSNIIIERTDYSETCDMTVSIERDAFPRLNETLTNTFAGKIVPEIKGEKMIIVNAG